MMLENRVRELRARFRWTQQDLADAIGVKADNWINRKR